jgi:4-alpha-glucanotransferase
MSLPWRGTCRSAAQKQFVTCKFPNPTTYAWWHKLKEDMKKDIFFRDLEAGEKLDHSVTPVHREHVESILKTYAGVDEWDIVTRRAIILNTWTCAGAF